MNQFTSAESFLAVIKPQVQEALARESSSTATIVDLYILGLGREPFQIWLDTYDQTKWIGPLQTSDGLLVFSTFVITDYISLEFKLNEGLMKWTITSLMNGAEKEILI